MTNEWLQSLSNMYAFFMLLVYPLTIRNGYFDVATTKLVFFYTISILFILANLGARLFFAIKGTDMGLTKIPLAEKILLIILFACYLITFLRIGNYANFFFAFAESHMSIAFLSICIIVFIFLRQAPINKDFFALFAILGSAFVSILAVIQYFGHDPGNMLAISEMGALMSTMSNKDLIGYYFTAMLPFGFYLTTTKKWYYIVVGALSTALTELGVLVCDTDAAIACFGAELILLVIFCAHNEGFKLGYPICLISMGIGHTILGYASLAVDSTIEVSYICSLMLHPYVGIFLIVAGLLFFVLLKFVNHKILKGLAIFAFLFVLAYPLYVMYYTKYRSAISPAEHLPFDSFLLFGERYGSGRGFLWMITMGIFKESGLIDRLIGYGAHGYGLQYYTYCMQHYHFYKYLDFPYYDAHNMYLHFLIEYGIIGLSASMAFIIYRIAYLFRIKDEDCFYRIKVVVIITGMISAVWLFCSNVTMAFLPLIL